MEARMTIREALLQASSLLTDNGVEDGRHEAELLLLSLLGWERSRLLLDGGELFATTLHSRWEAMLARRCAGEPVQYIIGEQEFYGLPFEVNPAVLIPRPETELLVEAVVKRVQELWGSDGIEAELDKSAARPKQQFLLADIGTGSGAIAVTLAVKLPEWRVASCDISPDALTVAQRNAVRNRVADRITFHQGNLLEPLLRQGKQVHVLVSNPPYIESDVIAGLQREVRDHEPRLALDGGADGLDFYREIVKQTSQLSESPRLFGLEVGQGQAPAVAELLMQAALWTQTEIVTDYSGIERHVLAWR